MSAHCRHCFGPLDLVTETWSRYMLQNDRKISLLMDYRALCAAM